MFRPGKYNISRKILAWAAAPVTRLWIRGRRWMDEFDGSYILKKLKEGQQKIGEASGAKKKKLVEHFAAK